MQNNIQELESRLSSIKVNHDFYSTGFDFYTVEPKSANHLFGNGRWKKTIIDAVGEQTFNDLCERYGNKPIDFKIACLKTKQASYFAINESIKVNDANNIYSGTFKVLGTEPDGVYIIAPYKGESRGKLSNQSRFLGADKALKKHIQMLNDLKPTIPQTMKSNLVENESTSMIQEDTNNTNFWNKESFWTKNNKQNKKLAIAAAIITAIVVGFIIYKQYKSKTK